MSWQAAQRNWLKHYDVQVPPTLTYPRAPLYCLLDETAARYPARPCTNFFGRRLTYQQVQALSDRLPALVLAATATYGRLCHPFL